jgi:2',3'-cyclic-nucleotide 2'-phosphodiesterase (5'-nucleotidase family)
MRSRCLFYAFWFSLVLTVARGETPAGVEALLVIVGDQHSAYERTAQVVAWIDRLRTENPRLPMAVLIDGDVFELGNVVARRSAGAVDFAMLKAFAQRAPTVLNVGNHEPEFYELEDTLTRIRASGVNVISNIASRATGSPFVPASTRLKLGDREAVIVGLTTDHLATFREAVRPSLTLADPAVWGRENFPRLLSDAPVKIVLSHAGLPADRSLLPLVPQGTLFAGAHDHLRFVHREGRTVYVHSGSWNESLTLAYLRVDSSGVSWEVRQQRIEIADPTDPAIASLIRDTRAKSLTAEDLAVIGRSPQALSPDEAARFAVRAVRVAAGVDAALVGHTTFGAGLPAGDVTRVDLDACVRFDGAICTAEVTGAQLQSMLAAANENADTAFAQRHGDYLVADGPSVIDPARRYKIATSDWIARNPRLYLGSADIALKEQPGLRLKAIVSQALGQ